MMHGVTRHMGRGLPPCVIQNEEKKFKKMQRRLEKQQKQLFLNGI
jgi:hypothetical protein